MEIDPRPSADMACRHTSWTDGCGSCKASQEAAAAAGPIGQVYACVMSSDSGADQLEGIYEVLGREGLKVP